MPDSDSIRSERNLAALVEFSRVVNSSLDLSFTLNNLLFSSFGKFLTGKGFVLLQRGNGLSLEAVKGVKPELLLFFTSVPTINQLVVHPEFMQRLSELKLAHYDVIESSGRQIGCIFLGEKITRLPYSVDEKEFLKTILNIAATAVTNAFIVEELKGLNKQLDTRVNRLNSLFEVSKEFNALLDEERIGKLLLFSLLGHFLVSTYAIIYLEDGKSKILESTLPRTTLAEALECVNIGTITGYLSAELLEERCPQLANLNFRLAVPMRMQNETLGLVLLGKRMGTGIFEASDVEFIFSLAGLAINSLENRRLFKEALEKQKMEEELLLARDIQRNLLPKQLPPVPGLDIAAFSIPSKQIGGDYYDVIDNGNGVVHIAIGDVSGKGIPASLLMANLQAFLKSISRLPLPLEQAAGLLNDLVSENTSDGRFITFFWGSYNVSARTFRYVNAGHNPPLYLHQGKLAYLDAGGVILGVMPTIMPYQSGEILLQPGDALLLFTDGVTEAKNKADEEYEDKRLESLFLKQGGVTAAALLDAVIGDINSHVLGFPQSDDITILTVKAV